MSYNVIARVRVKPEFKDQFLEKLARHARLSREEPGCQIFNVSQTIEDPCEIFFYEVYNDEAAFNEHRGYQRVQDHLKSVSTWLEDGSWAKKLTVMQIT